MRQPFSAIQQKRPVAEGLIAPEVRQGFGGVPANRIAAGFFLLLTSASAAVAHPGHFADVAGHAHWIGLAAAGAAAVIAGWLAGNLSEDEADEDETEEQDA